jgi:hypothetical protein
MTLSAEFTGANNADFISDEQCNSSVIDAMIQNFAERLTRLAGRKYVRPLSFLGFGASRIIRDLIWELRCFFPDDHKYHKENGLYDFPYKKFKAIAMILLITPLTKIPAFRKKITKSMTKEIIKQFQKIIDSA